MNYVRFILKLDTTNAAFCSGADEPHELQHFFAASCEVARILRGVALQLDTGPHSDAVIRDSNGNTVGSWRFIPELAETLGLWESNQEVHHDDEGAGGSASGRRE